MSKFVVQHMKSVTSLASSPYSHNLFYFSRIRRFCATPTRVDNTNISFTVNYLINSCGLAPEKAFWASKHVKFDVADKPNSVLNFFKDHVLTQTQILRIVSCLPRLLISNPEKTFLPKLECLRSQGMSGTDIAAVISEKPRILRTSLKSIDSCSDRSSFTINYLINSCGLAPERALSVSKNVKFDIADKPNSVLTFFKDHGFTQTQISKIVNSCPSLLISNPEKTLLPKLEFLRSKGLSGSDIALVISRKPEFLKRSLERHIIAFFNFLSKFLQSEEKAIFVFQRNIGASCYFDPKYIKVNIDMLKQADVPIKNIRFLVTYQPSLLMTTQDKLGQVVGEVKKLGFDPSKIHFVLAIRTLKSMTKSTWDRKAEVYKQWGWSENDIINAFRKSPMCMTFSEDKISSGMEVLVNKMGLGSSFLAHRPHILIFSLEKRILPRCEVYQFLVSKGLIKPADIRLATMLTYAETCFLKKVIDPYKEAFPELLKLYSSNNSSLTK